MGAAHDSATMSKAESASQAMPCRRRSNSVAPETSQGREPECNDHREAGGCTSDRRTQARSREGCVHSSRRSFCRGNRFAVRSDITNANTDTRAKQPTGEPNQPCAVARARSEITKQHDEEEHSQHEDASYARDFQIDAKTVT